MSDGRKPERWFSHGAAQMFTGGAVFLIFRSFTLFLLYFISLILLYVTQRVHDVEYKNLTLVSGTDRHICPEGHCLSRGMLNCDPSERFIYRASHS